jgi:hypothetical protein
MQYLSSRLHASWRRPIKRTDEATTVTHRPLLLGAHS